MIPIIQSCEGPAPHVALAILGFVSGLMSARPLPGEPPHAYGYRCFFWFLPSKGRRRRPFLREKLFGRRTLRPRDQSDTNLGRIARRPGGRDGAALAHAVQLPALPGALQLVLTALSSRASAATRDLTISIIKRDVGVHDLGVLDPGSRRTMLDRIDSRDLLGPLFFHCALVHERVTDGRRTRLGRCLTPRPGSSEVSIAERIRHFPRYRGHDHLCAPQRLSNRAGGVLRTYHRLTVPAANICC